MPQAVQEGYPIQDVKREAMRVALSIIDTALEALQRIYGMDDAISNQIAGIEESMNDLEERIITQSEEREE